MVEALYKKFYSKLYLYGCLVHTDAIRVEDTIQNFFIWVLEHPEKVKKINNFEAFACKSIRRNLIQRVIKDNRNKENNAIYVKGILQEKTIISIEKEIMKIEENLLQKENLKNAIEKLPEKQKEIIYLKYYANFSYKEIEDIMHVSNQVARNYVSRALKKLKNTLFSEGIKLLAIHTFLL